MRRSSLAAILMALATAAATVALAGCGGKEEGSSTKEQSKTTMTHSGLHTKHGEGGSHY